MNENQKININKKEKQKNSNLNSKINSKINCNANININSHEPEDLIYEYIESGNYENFESIVSKICPELLSLLSKEKKTKLIQNNQKYQDFSFNNGINAIISELNKITERLDTLERDVSKRCVVKKTQNIELETSCFICGNLNAYLCPQCHHYFCKICMNKSQRHPCLQTFN